MKYSPTSRRLIHSAALALLATAGFASLPFAAWAAHPAAALTAPGDVRAGGPEQFVDEMAKKTVAFLADKSLSEEQKRQDFENLLGQDFDLDTIGRFVLGTYWNQATPDQKAEYLGLFKQMISRIWTNRFEGYNGQTFSLRGSRADGERDILVASVIVPPQNSGPEVHVDWRVRNRQGRFQVVDVIVEGVSLSVTQRSDFASVIQRGGGNVEVLLKTLRQQVR